MERGDRERYYEHYFHSTLFVRQMRDNALFWSTAEHLQRLMVEKGIPVHCVENIYAMKIVSKLQQTAVDVWCSNHRGAAYVNDDANGHILG